MNNRTVQTPCRRRRGEKDVYLGAFLWPFIVCEVCKTGWWQKELASDDGDRRLKEPTGD